MAIAATFWNEASNPVFRFLQRATIVLQISLLKLHISVIQASTDKKSTKRSFLSFPPLLSHPYPNQHWLNYVMLKIALWLHVQINFDPGTMRVNAFELNTLSREECENTRKIRRIIRRLHLRAKQNNQASRISSTYLCICLVSEYGREIACCIGPDGGHACCCRRRVAWLSSFSVFVSSAANIHNNCYRSTGPINQITAEFPTLPHIRGGEHGIFRIPTNH